MNQLYAVAGAIALLVMVIFLLLQKKAPSYLPLEIMTANEQEFFGRMSRALGRDYYIFPQVAMSALIRPKESYEKNKPAYWKISKKRIDYAIYNQSMTLLCLVELDDKSHNVSRDRERDSWTASAGIRTIRWQSHTRPNEQTIRSTILNVQ